VTNNKGGSSAREILGRTTGQSARQRSLQRGSRQVQDRTETQSVVNAAAPKGRGANKHGDTKRITVDLPRDEHKFLRDFAYDHDTDGMRVVRALLMELRSDSGLSGRVLMRLEEEQQERAR
jgi:hypothetical protein